MGRAASKEVNKVVKSYRMGEDELESIKVFMESEECDQSKALRLLIQYGILYYTMNVIEEG
jgi:hypothetical protein